VITLNIAVPPTVTSGSQTLSTTVRYPAIGVPEGSIVTGATPLRRVGGYPLVVFSQGFALAPATYARLLDAWAAAGFIVAAPAYPFTSPNSPGGLVRTDIVNHPAELSRVITALLTDSAQVHGVLSGLINRREIGVAGHSDGGDVSLAIAENTCCRDRRVKAAVILSGAELSWFGGAYVASPTLRLLVVQGTDDTIFNPVACSIQLYDHASEPKYYLSMIGQNHLSAYLPGGSPFNVVRRVTIDFLNAYLRQASSSLAALTKSGSVAGLATITTKSSIAPVGGECPDAPNV
jgi:predicted dienelactone hydrolase